MTPQEPNVTRVLLRVEMADGQIREFVARDPHDVQLTVQRPGCFPGVPALPPTYITAGEAATVTLELKASRDYQKPLTISTDDEAERCVTCGSAAPFWHPQHREAV